MKLIKMLIENDTRDMANLIVSFLLGADKAVQKNSGELVDWDVISSWLTPVLFGMPYQKRHLDLFLMNKLFGIDRIFPMLKVNDTQHFPPSLFAAYVVYCGLNSITQVSDVRDVALQVDDRDDASTSSDASDNREDSSDDQGQVVPAIETVAVEVPRKFVESANATITFSEDVSVLVRERNIIALLSRLSNFNDNIIAPRALVTGIEIAENTSDLYAVNGYLLPHYTDYCASACTYAGVVLLVAPFLIWLSVNFAKAIHTNNAVYMPDYLERYGERVSCPVTSEHGGEFRYFSVALLQMYCNSSTKWFQSPWGDGCRLMDGRRYIIGCYDMPQKDPFNDVFFYGFGVFMLGMAVLTAKGLGLAFCCIRGSRMYEGASQANSLVTGFEQNFLTRLHSVRSKLSQFFQPPAADEAQVPVLSDEQDNDITRPLLSGRRSA